MGLNAQILGRMNQDISNIAKKLNEVIKQSNAVNLVLQQLIQHLIEKGVVHAETNSNKQASNSNTNPESPRLLSIQPQDAGSNGDHGRLPESGVLPNTSSGSDSDGQSPDSTRNESESDSGDPVTDTGNSGD